MADTEVVAHTLRRQLTAFSQLSTRSLGESNIDSLMLDACLRARAGMDVSHAKLLEYIPERDRLCLRAGVGWKEGYVNQYAVAPALDTPVGHAFVFSEPVPITDYREEHFFEHPSILKEHGCVASLNVPLRTDRGNFGVLEVDHTAVRSFSQDDINFLTGLGNTVARAVELRRAMRDMETALNEKQLLLREMNHRIKNNLTLVVAAMLSLQARRFSDEKLSNELASAVNRIHNLALVHDRLQLFTSSISEIDAISLPGFVRNAPVIAPLRCSIDVTMQRGDCRGLRRSPDFDRERTRDECSQVRVSRRTRWRNHSWISPGRRRLEILGA